jgi:hypothetical protein
MSSGSPGVSFRHPGSVRSDEPPAVHRVASLLQRWLLGTHQGGVDRLVAALPGIDGAWDGHVLGCGERDAHALVRLRPHGCGHR